jgi:O-acetyl-ADP-ribose deacetylase (regulator of RNase III)
LTLSVVLGDITKATTDAIVNAANSSLLGGGGVDGAIHKAAGTELLEECKLIREKHGKCNPGEAVLTKGYKLKAAYIIHTVGPIWNDGKSGEPQVLENCYKNSIKIAIENSIKTISFPNISTGVYGYPKEAAAKVVFDYFHKVQNEKNCIEKIVFICFDQENYQIYCKYIKNY